MGLLKDEHRVQVSGADVIVTGESGLVEATWTLEVDGEEVDRAKASGRFELRGRLPDGSGLAAQIHQDAFGPTKVIVLHDDAEVTRFTGFVV
jgi:hypothetical protein